MNEISEFLQNALGISTSQLDLIPRRNANNALYKVTADNGDTFAVKLFAGTSPQDRDRFDREAAALAFFKYHAVQHVPYAIAVDAKLHLIVYPWIDGPPSVEVNADFVIHAWRFIESLHALRTSQDATVLPKATEACLCIDALVKQISDRLARLNNNDVLEPEMLAPLLPRIKAQLDAIIADAAPRIQALQGLEDGSIARHLQTLSPSDFGTHNAILSDSGPVFIDFEYFGWDDPVKLCADFMWHPGMNLGGELRELARREAVRIFSADETFPYRLRLLYPLYGLRWSLIILNPFAPERWDRMYDAGERRSRDDVLKHRVESASKFLDAVEAPIDEWISNCPT